MRDGGIPSLSAGARVCRDSGTTFATADVGVRGKKLLEAEHFTPSIDRGRGLGGGVGGERWG